MMFNMTPWDICIQETQSSKATCLKAHSTKQQGQNLNLGSIPWRYRTPSFHFVRIEQHGVNTIYMEAVSFSALALELALGSSLSSDALRDCLS